MKNAIGARIKAYREKNHLNQKQLADLIGASNSRLSNWEQGINYPDVEMIVELCNALKVSADTLLDVHLKEEEFTECEKELVFKYRHKTEMQEAVNTLLDIKVADTEKII